MALGDNRGNNKLFESTYYSRLGFNSQVSKNKLGFSFKSGMLVLNISKTKDGGGFDSLIDSFITSTKSKILLNMIREFEEDIKNGTVRSSGYGIQSGLGSTVTLTIIHLTEDGHKAITIEKVDESGTVTEGYTVVFNSQYHYGIKLNDYKDVSSFNNVYQDDVEFEQFKTVLSQFEQASNGAAAYFVHDLGRYDHAALMNKMNPIYDKLGIERNRNNNSGGGNSYFNRNNGSSSHKSYEDMEEDLPFADDEE